jgi:hypothetical protein
VAKQKDKKTGKKAYRQSSAYLKKGPKKPKGKRK